MIVSDAMTTNTSSVRTSLALKTVFGINEKLKRFELAYNEFAEPNKDLAKRFQPITPTITFNAYKRSELPTRTENTKEYIREKSNGSSTAQPKLRYARL